jgi:hypothetical protein
MKLIFSLVLVICLYDVSAQNLKLTGTIRDAKDNSALVGATVSLAPTKDTNNLLGALTDMSGNFKLTYLKKGTYLIKVTYIGYVPLVRYLKMDSTDKNLGTLKLKSASDTLKMVTVQVRAVHVEQKADTTEYNAQTYKTNPDATAEDLLNKMPGITSANGTVTAHGETVQKVLVDGKEFFGDDATAAIKNLPAEIIDKVQVFDRLSDQSAFTGFDDGNSVKTINITTKKGRNNGVFGKIYAGYGYLNDSRYSVGGNLNWFNGNRRISLIGLSNNINQQNFSSQDLLGVQGGGGGRGGGRQGGGGGSNFLIGNLGGLITTHSLCTNYIDVWGKKKKVKVAGSLFFNQTDNTTLTSLTRQYYYSNKVSSLYNENDSSRSININQRVNLRIEYSIDSNNTLVFTPKFSYQKNTQYYDLAGQTMLGGSEQSHTVSDQYSYNSGYNITGDILFQHKFPQKFKTFSVDIGTTISNKAGNGNQTSFTYYDTTNSTVPLDQQYLSYSHSYTVNANMSLTEPVNANSMIQLNYVPSYTWNRSDQETDTLNHTDNKYTLLDTILSDKYNNIYVTQRIGLSYRYRSKSMNASLGVYGQEALLSGENVFPYQYSSRLDFLSVLPIAMFNYRFGTISTLRIMYRTSTSPPSISQLQSVINNSNPLLLSTGNPNLNQSYTQSLTIRYGLAHSTKGHAFFVFANISNTMGYVANSTIIASQDTLIDHQVILHKGSQFTLPVNVNGNWSANSLLTYGVAIEPMKCNLNLSGGVSYSRIPGLVNNELSISSTYVPTASLVLSSNVSEKIDFTFSYSATYNVIQNTIQTNTNNNYFGHTAGGKFNWLFWKGFVFNTSLTNTYYESNSQGFNQDIFIWSAALGYKFLKDKSLDIRAGVNDIFNQNSGLSRTVSQTYVEDDRTKVLGRYILFTATWTLRYYKKTDTGGYSGGGGPGGYGGYGGDRGSGPGGSGPGPFNGGGPRNNEPH